MGKLQAGLDAFKSKYGVYPPSRVRLREGTAYNTNEGFDAHSLKVLKQIWPSFNPVTVAGTAGDPNTAQVADESAIPLVLRRSEQDPPSIRRPNVWTDTYELEGDECLVFFLGGIAEFDRSIPNPTIILHGFTKRANDPSGIPNANIPATQTRDAPLVEFERETALHSRAPRIRSNRRPLDRSTRRPRRLRTSVTRSRTRRSRSI